MTAVVIPLRQALQASLDLPPDVIEFVGAIEDRRNELNALLRDIGFACAAGASPGAGTVERLETIGSRTLGLALAWAVAKGIA